MTAGRFLKSRQWPPLIVGAVTDDERGGKVGPGGD
jgi:hypothetical protein